VSHIAVKMQKEKTREEKKRKIKHLLDQSSKNIGGVQKQPGYFAY